MAKKEIVNRYDFHGSKTEVDLNKKELTLLITTENEMRLDAVLDAVTAARPWPRFPTDPLWRKTDSSRPR